MVLIPVAFPIAYLIEKGVWNEVIIKIIRKFQKILSKTFWTLIHDFDFIDREKPTHIGYAVD